MKNIIRVTAIILTMVTVIVTHPFLSLEAKVFERPIKNDRIFNTTYPNNTYAQISYEYKVDNPLQGDIDFAQFNIYGTYEMILYINFKQDFDVINFTFTLTNPYVTTYNLNYAVINGYALSSNTQYSTITIEAKNTDMVEVHIVWDNDMVAKMYHYYWIDNMLEGALTSADVIATDWVEHGYDWCDILSFRVNSYTLASDPLATLETTTGNIYSSINNISADLIDIEDVLIDIYEYEATINQSIGTINTTITKDRLLNEWIAGTQATNERVLNSYFFGYIYNNTGPGHPNTKRTWYLGNGLSFNNNARVNIPTYVSSNPMSGPTWEEIQNLKLIIYFKAIDGPEGVYYVNLPRTNLSETTYTNNLYIYSKKDNSIYRIEIANTLDYDYTTTGAIQITMEYLSLSNLSVYTLVETNYIDQVYITAEPINQEQLMQKILDEIRDVSINVNVSNTEVNNSVTEYNTNIDYVYNIENNINTQLNTALEGFTLPDNTSLIDSLNYSSIMFNSVLNRLNGISIISVPLTIALVGIILIAILG